MSTANDCLCLPEHGINPRIGLRADGLRVLVYDCPICGNRGNSEVVEDAGKRGADVGQAHGGARAGAAVGSAIDPSVTPPTASTRTNR